MPLSHKSNEKITKSKEPERDNSDVVWLRQSGADASQPDAEGDQSVWLNGGSDIGSLFSFIHEEHLQEAQEFRRKGYNSQVPEVDPMLVTHLLEAVSAAESCLCVQTNIQGPLGSLWLLEQIRQIKRYAVKLSVDRMQGWVSHEVASINTGKAGDNSLGSRSAAQSLTRRLESTLQTLIRVVHTLRSIDDYSTPEKRRDMLVTELTDAFSSSDEKTVLKAMERMTADAADNGAWSSLIEVRAASHEIQLGWMIKTVRHEAEKANKKARELLGEPQAFFSDLAAYLQRLSSDLAKAPINVNQSTSPQGMQKLNDEAAASLSESDSLPQKMKDEFAKANLKFNIALSGMKELVLRAGRVIKHRHATETRSKDPEEVIADSIIRSILWQWQQSAIKIQYASRMLLSKVEELQKIEEIFSPDSLAHDSGNEQGGDELSASHLDGASMDAQVRQWVFDNLQQEDPENQRKTKLAVLQKLLGGDIANAHKLVARWGKAEGWIQNRLKQQQSAVLDMAVKRRPIIAPSLTAVDKLLPDIAKGLSESITALDKALNLLITRTPTCNFSEAEKQINFAHLQAKKVKEKISAESVRITERPLDEYSRSSRLAKHWANLAKEQNVKSYPRLSADQVFSSLKTEGLLEGVISTGDPEGYLFATRLAEEIENIRNDEFRLPMSPEEYTALEKNIIEYIVKWGQGRIARGGVSIAIELSFEQAFDTITFKLYSLIGLPCKILNASIKIPYQVNKVNNYTMPGQDKPYKAIYGLLGKKLKQLGFDLIMVPVPGVIKLAAGIGVTTGAGLYNLSRDGEGNTFIAVYERVAEGKKSRKIEMKSPQEMGVAALLEAGSMSCSKGMECIEINY